MDRESGTSRGTEHLKIRSEKVGTKDKRQAPNGAQPIVRSHIRTNTEILDGPGGPGGPRLVFSMIFGIAEFGPIWGLLFVLCPDLYAGVHLINLPNF